MFNAFTIPVINTHLHNNLIQSMLASTTTSDQTFSSKWKCDPRGGWGPLLLGAIVHMWLLPTSFVSKQHQTEMNTWLFNISILASIYEAVEKRVASLESKPSGLINDYLKNVKLSRSNCALVKCKKNIPGNPFSILRKSNTNCYCCNWMSTFVKQHINQWISAWHSRDALSRFEREINGLDCVTFCGQVGRKGFKCSLWEQKDIFRRLYLFCSYLQNTWRICS